MLIRHKGKRIFAFSDTHGMHQKLIIPRDVDILICAGDVTADDTSNEEIKQFFEWYLSIPAQLRLFVAGNHEIIFDIDPYKGRNLIPHGICFLDNSVIKYEELVFCSLSARPWMHTEMKIPHNVDFLITHGAPKGILDENHGCEILSNVVQKQIPEFHLFGHCHAMGLSTERHSTTTYKNISYYNQLK